MANKEKLRLGALLSAVLLVPATETWGDLATPETAINEYNGETIDEKDRYVGYSGDSPYLSCEGAWYCLFAGVVNGGIWAWRDGYPEFERSIFRPFRDFVGNPNKFCREHENNDMCKVTRELDRVVEDIGKETKRVADQIGDEGTRVHKKIEKGIKKLGDALGL